jgi:ADP-ribose pyrophosphatase
MSEILYAARWLRLMKRDRWEYVERTNPGGAAIIVAVTPQENVLLIEQFRQPIQCKTIEFPAGLIGDEPGKAEEVAHESAARELEEETGWLPARVEHIQSGPSSAGMSTEIQHFYRAYGLMKTGPGGGLPGEGITVHEVPLAEVAKFIATRMREGFAVDPKVYAGLYFLQFDSAGRALPAKWWIG